MQESYNLKFKLRHVLHFKSWNYGVIYGFIETDKSLWLKGFKNACIKKKIWVLGWNIEQRILNKV